MKSLKKSESDTKTATRRVLRMNSMGLLMTALILWFAISYELKSIIVVCLMVIALHDLVLVPLANEKVIHK